VMRRRKCPPCDGITGKLICKNIDRYIKSKWGLQKNEKCILPRTETPFNVAKIA
jgi:hypothetical protein